MSRLHEIKVKGPDNVLLPKILQTEHCKTVGDKLVLLTGDDSPRKGNRNKTKLKTARALGSNATPTGSWGSRNQGEAGKAEKIRSQRAIANQAKKFKRGDKA